MISNSRDPAGGPRSAAPADPGPARTDLEKAADRTLVELISRGSVPAFVALFDRTSGAALAELAGGFPGGGRAGEILAASYVEVWWLAGCHRTPEVDVTSWITGIVRRRMADAARGTPRHGGHAAWEGPRPSYAELEVAALLRRPVGHLWQA